MTVAFIVYGQDSLFRLNRSYQSNLNGSQKKIQIQAIFTQNGGSSYNRENHYLIFSPLMPSGRSIGDIDI